MANERKQIRDEIKAVIESVYNGVVITSRVYDVRDETEYVSVYFESGETEWDGLNNFTTATIVVSYFFSELVSDDDLDVVADSINSALEIADIAPNLMRGFLPDGFEYLSEQESAFSGISLRYKITY